MVHCESTCWRRVEGWKAQWKNSVLHSTLLLNGRSNPFKFEHSLQYFYSKKIYKIALYWTWNGMGKCNDWTEQRHFQRHQPPLCRAVASVLTCPLTCAWHTHVKLHSRRFCCTLSLQSESSSLSGHCPFSSPLYFHHTASRHDDCSPRQTPHTHTHTHVTLICWYRLLSVGNTCGF